jgi:hypothetical protein
MSRDLPRRAGLARAALVASAHAVAAAALALAALAMALGPTPAAAAGPFLTLYTSDLGLVRESRSLDLAGARDTVRLTDIPDRLDFSSVRLAPEGEARVTRLAYRYDVESGDRMIEAAIGNRVRVLGRGDRMSEGTLLAADGTWLVLRGDDGGLTTLARAAVEEVRLAHPLATLSTRPTLEAVVEGGRRGRVNAELSYLTGGLSWSAEHVVVRRGENAADWSATVQIVNTSGRDYADADLKLVAGEPRRELKGMPMPVRAGMMDAMARSVAPTDLSEQSFSEYHLYTLGRRALLRDRETQSLTMIEPHRVQVTPRYVYRGGDPRGVAATMEIVNSAAAGPGVPLAGGRVRIYEPDPDGALQFVGETRISHTAVDEKATLEIGSAFDLAAERREVESKRISDREREYSVEIKLRNRKKTAVTIRVEEPVPGDSEILAKSLPFTRKDSNTIQFEIPVAAGKEAVLTYTARVRY